MFSDSKLKLLEDQLIVKEKYKLAIVSRYIIMELWIHLMGLFSTLHIKEINPLKYKLVLEKLSRDGTKELLECV